jgi:Cu(I)/Ag(I) efflux system membrane fusion protein
MHPQIKLPEAGKCPICFMDLIPLEVEAGDDAAAPKLELSEAARALAEIATAELVRERPFVEVRLIGKIEADETRLSALTARVSGRLDRLYVDTTGELVKQGEALAEIYSPELLAAAEELNQAQRTFSSLSENASPARRESAAAVLTAAREKLRLLGIAGEQIEAIAAGDVPSDHVTLQAGATGVVIEKNAVEGDYVRTGSVILRIADLTHLWVNLAAYESDLAWLRLNQEVEFTAQALPGERFSGRISFISPTLDERTRTVTVRVEAANENGSLKPGMLVRGLVLAEAGAEGALLVPRSAVLFTGKRSVVYVEVPNSERPTYEGREIVLGPRAGDSYILREGLVEGERVVVHGSFKIDSALQIQAKPSMMSRRGTPSDAGGDEAGTGSERQDFAVSAEFSADLNRLYEAYFALANGLAADDFAVASAHVATLREAIGDVTEKGLAAHERREWRRLASGLESALGGAATVKDLAGLRAEFSELSSQVIELERTFGHTGERSFFLAHCPMAFSFAGADWLQDHEQITNPYYGAQMLRCGEVRAEYAAAAAGGE